MYKDIWEIFDSAEDFVDYAYEGPYMETMIDTLFPHEELDEWVMLLNYQIDHGGVTEEELEATTRKIKNVLELLLATEVEIHLRLEKDFQEIARSLGIHVPTAEEFFGLGDDDEDEFEE